MTSANERWTQRIMGGLGVRPVGHADPADDGAQIPVQSPVPPQPAAPHSSPRMPDWWRAGRPPLSTVPDLADDPDDDEDNEDQEQQADEEEPMTTVPVPGGPVVKVPHGQKRTSVRKAAENAVDDRTARIIAFNLTAGGVGYGIGLVPLLGGFLPAAEHGALGMFSLCTAATGAYVAWWATRFPAVRKILPHPPVSRTIIIAGAAAIGRELAPIPVDWLNAHGERWGLGPSAMSLLLTAGGMCGGLWWLIDRRARSWHWLARWVVRIPLASALLATALYAPGT
ncbi:hypothetical protein OOK58_42195 [Streptomyces sp. NBC_01728]|uniref:hypothetical protein n=1 Tax=unclassified Streptomyces TaxID=2593676 RepID=UPI0022596CE1|nr:MULTISPECIES: hypothetical protein [unclassified Streptomyces]MCX4458527.1 hypothetical protein [Streptomyces sp. NBC_01719]MCX4497884.1 hypothetical protein [Streptomyces sp. NBC_01728]